MSTSFSPTSLAAGAARQQVLGAVDLGRLGQHGGAAVAHQQVDGGAERRVGGDAGIAVRAAALQGEHQLAGGDRLAVRLVGAGQHLLDAGDAGLDGLLGAAGVLDGHGAEVVALDQAVLLLEPRDLEHLAAEAHHQRGGQVGMAGVAPLRALERLVALALGGEAAAGAVHEGDDAVDVGVLLQDAGPGDGLGHEAGHRGRAVHAGQDADVVARAGLAVGAAEAFEGGARLGRQQLLVARILGEGVVALEGGERAVVRVHVAAGSDVLGGEADDLAELEDRLALGDRLRPPSCGRASRGRRP